MQNQFEQLMREKRSCIVITSGIKNDRNSVNLKCYSRKIVDSS